MAQPGGLAPLVEVSVAEPATLSRIVGIAGKGGIGFSLTFANRGSICLTKVNARPRQRTVPHHRLAVNSRIRSATASGASQVMEWPASSIRCCCTPGIAANALRAASFGIRTSSPA